MKDNRLPSKRETTKEHQRFLDLKEIRMRGKFLNDNMCYVCGVCKLECTYEQIRKHPTNPFVCSDGNGNVFDEWHCPYCKSIIKLGAL